MRGQILLRPLYIPSSPAAFSVRDTKPLSSCHCGRRFSDPSALQQHQRSKAHCYCRECDRFFVYTDSVEQHRSTLRSFTCFDCDRIFVRPEALQRHQNYMGHCYCRECDRFFVTSDALSQHLQSPLHTTQFHCCDCDRDFVDEQTLHQHLADKIHNPRTLTKISSIKLSNWVCKECEREFKAEKRLEQHRSSVVHKPLSNLKCVGDRRCKKRFSSPSAWLHHLESGACPSSITRDKLHKAVQSSDVDHLITKAASRNTQPSWRQICPEQHHQQKVLSSRRSLTIPSAAVHLHQPV